MIFEYNEAIIDNLTSVFGSTVSNSDALERLVSFGVSDGNYEGVGSMVLAFDDELGPDDTHGGQLSSSSNPELHVHLQRSVDYELLVVVVIDALSLDISGVAPVAALGESEATDVLDRQSIAHNLFVDFAGVVGVDRLKIQEDADIVLHAEAQVEIVHGMGGNRQSVSIIVIYFRVHQGLLPYLVVRHQHLKSRVPFLLSCHFLHVSLPENVQVFRNYVHRLFLDIGILLREN